MDRIDALRLVVRLSEHRNISAAARSLQIKPSTASKWLAELEEQLGVHLVERSTRALRLTEDGQHFVTRAQGILADFDDLSRSVQSKTSTPRGTLRMSAPVVFGSRFVLPPLANFARENPGVELSLSLQDRYVNLLEEGYDVAIRVGVPVESRARAKMLSQGKRYVVASPAYVAAHGRPENPRDLLRHECIRHGELSAPTVWRFGTQRGKEVPVLVQGKISVNHSEAARQLVQEGLGIALLADWLVQPDLDAGRLVALLENYTTPPAPICALTPPGRYTPAAVRVWLSYLADYLAKNLPTRRTDKRP